MNSKFGIHNCTKTNRHVYSFDIFDTIVTRKVIAPRDVYAIVQEELGAMDSNLPVILRKKFWAFRVWAEFMARRQSPAEDISLTDIYALLARQLDLSAGQQELLMSKELEMESLLMLPITGSQSLIAELRQKGAVVFVSDMYLPADFIRNLLVSFGFFMTGDRLYVSGNLGLSKASGGLFRHVLDDLGCSPHGMHHIGDNLWSDFIVPRRFGIESSLVFNEHCGRQLRFMHMKKQYSYALDLAKAYLLQKVR